MEKMGFSPLFINFLKILYKQNTSMIINNGFLSLQVSLLGGLTYCYPLPISVYMIPNQITTINIKKGKL